MKAFDKKNSLHRLLYHLFDYAGMFPPAALSLDEALTESFRHATTLNHPWIVGTDLVLDTAHSRLLAEYQQAKIGFSAPPSVSILITEGTSAALQTARALTGSEPESIGTARVVGFEVKISPETFSSVIKGLGDYLKETGILLAVEPDLSIPDWKNNLKHVVGEIIKSPFAQQLALKCRCTGPTGIGPERLAVAIIAAADAGIGFKVTGGLHHPIVEPLTHTYPMGFLNVTCAVHLRRILGAALPEASIVSLLTNDSIECLSFSDGILFKDFQVSLQQLIDSQLRAPFSIGSCSIHEPDDDLTRLLSPLL